MANLNEVSNWDASIFQLETTTPVLGGPGGVSNSQAQALANRSLYLKEQHQALVAQSGTAITTVTGNIALTPTEGGLILIDATTGNINITLALATALAALSYKLYRVDASVNAVNIVRAGVDTIAGEVSIPMLPGDYMALRTDEVDNWQILSDNRWLIDLITSAGLTPGVDRTLVSQAVGLLSRPTGEVMTWSTATPPSGYLECDGAAISRTTYAALFAVIGITFGVGDGVTTFNLPDLRGEFVRGWDNGRGIDSGRVLGSAQIDELKSHSHSLVRWNQIITVQLGTSGGFWDGSVADVTGLAGGSETRPRNIALMFCIKY